MTKQKAQLLDYLKQGHAITEQNAEALFGIKKLSSRLTELRNDGFIFEKGTGKNGKTSWKLAELKKHKKLISVKDSVHKNMKFIAIETGEMEKDLYEQAVEIGLETLKKKHL